MRGRRRRGLGLGITALTLSLGCGGGPTTDDASLITTRAERTGWEQTTGYGEVMFLMERAAGLSTRAHATTFGTTTEGRPLPLLIIGDVADSSPTSVLAAERTRVWLQATIHGGEVSGKEALIELIRDLLSGTHDDWLSSLVLLIAPVYNADGNEQMGDHRPYQLGPLQGMGIRENAQGLDLNRDHIKLESPEARALVRAYIDYDPHVVVDLHTTNGTQHGYHLTYAPALHPNTHPELDALVRKGWLPEITDAIRADTGWESYHYGNLRGEGAEASWRTFDHRPRFNNNYVGLRNRLALLSEAYAYAPFNERVRVTRAFVDATLELAASQAAEIAALVERVDGTPIAGQPLATRAEPRRGDAPVSILMGATDEVANPYTRSPMRRRLDVAEPTEMEVYIAFDPTETATAPATYYVPARLTGVVDLLAAHGIDGTELDAETVIAGEQFMVTASETADRPFEGHRIRTVEGEWEPAELRLTAGTLALSTTQPAGRLLFSLLEPRSDDGLVAWNILDDELAVNDTYPIVRQLASAAE